MTTPCRDSERAAVFDALYEGGKDPWDVLSSRYESDKYRATLATLGDAKFGHVLDVGCGFGVLTEKLAARSRHVTAIDASANAIARARQRGRSGVDYVCASVPTFWPAGSYGLILLSEVLYYLSEKEIISLSEKVAKSLRRGGKVLLVNWTGETDLPIDGDMATTLFGRAAEDCGLVQYSTNRHDYFRIDVLKGTSVASA